MLGGDSSLLHFDWLFSSLACRLSLFSSLHLFSEILQNVFIAEKQLDFLLGSFSPASRSDAARFPWNPNFFIVELLGFAGFSV